MGRALTPLPNQPMTLPPRFLRLPLSFTLCAFCGLSASAQQQVSVLVPTTAGNTDMLGTSAALIATRAVLGAPFATLPVLFGPSIALAGSVHVFEPSGANWLQTAELFPSDLAEHDHFGWSVATVADTIVVGAPHADLGALAPKKDAGAVYVFTKGSTGTWNQVQKLTAQDSSADAEFGYSVAAASPTAIHIGAPGDSGRGATYVFVLLPTGEFTQSAKLTSPIYGGRFGTSMAAEVNRVLVGDPEATGLTTPGSGRAHLFEFQGFSGWVETAALVPPTTELDQYFGNSVDLSGDLMLVGAPFALGGTGAADVFTNANPFGVWVHSKRIVVQGATEQSFGKRVALDGERAVISAGQYHLGLFHGAAFSFYLGQNGWVQSAQLEPSIIHDDFGQGLALFGTQALLGDPHNDIAATNGGVGALFDIEVAGVMGCSPSNPGGSLILADGTPALGTTWTLGVHNPLGTQVPGSLAFLTISGAQMLPDGCGTLIPGWGMAGPTATAELLVQPSAILIGPKSWNGSDPAPISLPIANKAALLGADLVAQGLIVGLSGSPVSLGMTEARAFQIGVSVP